MDVLLVTNLYPPYYLGGYELHCSRVAESLVARGHRVSVLTSDYGVSGHDRSRVELRKGVSVYRRLNQYNLGRQRNVRPWTIYHAMQQTRDVATFVALVGKAKPDVVNWWNLWGLSKLPLAAASELRIPAVYYIEDRWLIQEYGPSGEEPERFWRQVKACDWAPGLARPIARGISELLLARMRQLGVCPTDLGGVSGHACFLSDYLEMLHRREGIAFDSWEVIRGGVATEDFYAACDLARYETRPLRILYVGQITPDRGLHVIVEALGSLYQATDEDICLTVAGDGPEDYMAQVRDPGERWLSGRLSFVGKVPYERIPEVYRAHQLVIFSSARPEGLGFTMVEGMLAGCAVVTTGSGGAREVAELADLPVFDAGDSTALRGIVRDLAQDRTKLAEIARRGQRVAMREFGLDVTVERFIAALERAIEERRA